MAEITSGRTRRMLSVGRLTTAVGGSYLWQAIKRPFQSVSRTEQTLLDALETMGTVKHGEWEQKMALVEVALGEISRLSDKCAKAAKRLRVKVIKKNK